MITASPQPTAPARQISVGIATKKNPILVITNDNYGSPSVVFEGQGVRDILPSVEDYTPSMESELVSDNTEVKKFWSNLGILKTVHGDYYRYNINGDCEFISEALSTDIIDWKSEPEMEDEGVRVTISDTFYEITGGRHDFPSDANLGNGQTDSVESIVEEALKLVDRDTEHYVDENGLEGGAQ